MSSYVASVLASLFFSALPAYPAAPPPMRNGVPICSDGQLAEPVKVMPSGEYRWLCDFGEGPTVHPSPVAGSRE